MCGVKRNHLGFYGMHLGTVGVLLLTRSFLLQVVQGLLLPQLPRCTGGTFRVQYEEMGTVATAEPLLALIPAASITLLHPPIMKPAPQGLFPC